MTAPLTPERLAERQNRRLAYVIHDAICAESVHRGSGHKALCERAATAVFASDWFADALDDSRAEVDRLRAQVVEAWRAGAVEALNDAADDPEAWPKSNWLRERAEFIEQDTDMDLSGAAALASGDEAPSCQRCGSYSHTSCPVAPWETQ